MPATPTASRGELTLQPSYFTSSLFVQPLKDDITTLVHAYHELYTKGSTTQPFSLFKELWTSQGWKWLHFKAVEARGRSVFLRVVMRLFLERTVKTEPPFIRVVALFALYVFFYTQPKGTHPPLHAVSNSTISLDHWASLRALPDTLTTPLLLPLGPAVSHVLSRLFGDNVFILLPSSEFGAMNPRRLPHEILRDGTTPVPLEEPGQKKKGRPSKWEKARKSKVALDGLDNWLKDTAQFTSSSLPAASTSSNATHTPTAAPPTSSLNLYHTYKALVLDYLESPEVNAEGAGTRSLERANDEILVRLRAAEQSMRTESPGTTHYGLDRAEKAVRALRDRDPTQRGGLLSLLAPGDELCS